MFHHNGDVIDIETTVTLICGEKTLEKLGLRDGSSVYVGNI